MIYQIHEIYVFSLSTGVMGPFRSELIISPILPIVALLPLSFFD
jgi:hypothetical protein